MPSLKAGDRIDCRIKENNIVSSYSQYDDTRTFEIVAADDAGYYIFVPGYIYINGGTILDATRCRRLDIDPRFISEQIVYIMESYVHQISCHMDGTKCVKCQDFFTMAAPNQLDGTFLCRSCKLNPYR